MADPTPDGLTDSRDAAFLERVMRFLDDALPPADVRLLEQDLAADARLRDLFASICLSDSLVSEELPSVVAGDRVPDATLDSLESATGDAGQSMHDAMVLPALAGMDDADDEPLPLPSPPLPMPATPVQYRRWPLVGLAAAVLVAAALALTLLLKPDNPVIVVTQAAPSLAGTLHAEWDEGGSAAAGESLEAGRSLKLRRGYARIKFSDGSQAVLEGPATLTIDSGNGAMLAAGKVVVQMAPGASGFVLRTPQAVLVDQGTEFAVTVDPQTGVTDAHVFEGRVDISPGPTPPPAGTAAARSLVAGDAARAAGGAIEVVPEGAMPQLFVRDLDIVRKPLDLIDLLSGGAGDGGRYGVRIDPRTGDTTAKTKIGDPLPTPPAAAPLVGPPLRRVPKLPVVDGCFVPDPAGGLVTIDSAGHAFAFAPNDGKVHEHIYLAGGTIPQMRDGTTPRILLGDNFTEPGRGRMLLHANVGLTLDLAAIRRLHPTSKLTRFRATVFNGVVPPLPNKGRADFVLLVDGVVRHQRMGFGPKDDPFLVETPITDANRHLTFVVTDGGDGAAYDFILLGAPSLDAAAMQ